MQSQFIEKTLKTVIASICQNIGFQGIYSSPLNVLTDLLHRYLQEIAVTTHRYSEHDGRTLPNVDDLEMAFREMGISISELEEYVNFVEPTPYPHEVPKLPLRRPTNLNFIKAGAKEIVSRPLHVNEHLPPMYPEKEDAQPELNCSLENGVNIDSPEKSLMPSPSKRGSECDGSPTKRMKMGTEAEGEPVREIDSVMMTTSGFISSAREGKLPEARRPNLPMPVSRSSSPIHKNSSSLIKKKVTMEKIIRHKNHQSGIRPPGHLTKSKSKDHKLKPKIKIPSAPPGTGSLNHIRTHGGVPPKLKIPVPAVPVVVVAAPAAAAPVAAPAPQPPPPPPPPPPLSLPPDPTSSPQVKSEKDATTEAERLEKRRRRDERRREQKRRDRKERESNDPKYRDRMRIRMRGLTKEEELRRYKERENELIAKLAKSSAVTVTSIPPPSLRVREKTPDRDEGLSSPPSSSSSDSKGKLSVFRKSSKSKSSDGLNFDTPVIKEEPLSPPTSPSIDFMALPPEPPTIPITPETPKKIRERPSKSEKKVRVKGPPKSSTKNKSPRSRKKPSPPVLKGSESPIERPKTPELGVESPSTPFIPNVVHNAPSFIPPFNRFAFSMAQAFNNMPVTPVANDTPTIEQMFTGPITNKKDNEERPLTPSHDLGSPSGSNYNEERNLPLTPGGKDTIATTLNLPSKIKSKTEKEKKKEHKKEKKLKEKEKVKKKKEKDKAKEEKKKAKERLKLEKKEKKKRVKKEEKSKESVPKLTLKFQSGDDKSSEPKHTPKLVIKPVLKRPMDTSPPPVADKIDKISRPSPISSPPDRPSINVPPLEKSGSPPQIAKFSALITRPPKGSQSKKSSSSSNEPLTVPPLKIKDPGGLKLSKKELKIKPTKETKEPPPTSTVPPLKIKSAGINKFAEEKKSNKKSEKKEKKKRVLISPVPPPPAAPPSPPPVASPPRKRPTPTPPEPPSKPTSGLLTETVGPIGHFVDDQGNEVWICPTCGKQDDGSPMIGCDTCDDWYHWLCVGIHVPPNENENWYCPRCLSQHKQKGTIMEKKKRGRKRKFPPI